MLRAQDSVKDVAEERAAVTQAIGAMPLSAGNLSAPKPVENSKHEH